MPFWSHRAYAARAAIDEWETYEPTSIDQRDSKREKGFEKIKYSYDASGNKVRVVSEHFDPCDT